MANASLTRSRAVHLQPIDSVVSNRAFLCQRCGQSFSRKSILQDHLNVHDNKKPYACEYLNCMMAFVRKSDMRRHFATHTGAGKKFCARCQHWFSRKDGYLDHKCHLNSHRRKRRMERDAFLVGNLESKGEQNIETFTPFTLDCAPEDLHIQLIDVHDPVLHSVDQQLHSNEDQQVETLDELWPFTIDIPDTAQNPFTTFHPELIEESRDLGQSENPLQRIFPAVFTSGGLEGRSEDIMLSRRSEPLSYAGEDLGRVRKRKSTIDQKHPYSDICQSPRLVLSVPRPSKKHDQQRQCFLCDRKHLTTIELKEHFEQHQRDCNSPRRYSCSECEVSFHHHFELVAHDKAVQQIQTGSGECNCCGEAFGDIGVTSHQVFGRHLRGNDCGVGVTGYCYRTRMAQGHDTAKQIMSHLLKVSPNPLVRVLNSTVRRVKFCL